MGSRSPLGEVGEIGLRGPQVMKGYWNRPEETAHVFTADGWLRTGDMGVMDDRGSIRITDRKKDMIVVSGFKVFPNEIEDVLTMHPGVLEAAAIGVRDERSGEAVKVVVVRKDPALTEGDLLAHCRQHLTGYKMPRIVEFRSEPLPKTNIGKILRRELRDDGAAASAAPARGRSRIARGEADRARTAPVACMLRDGREVTLRAIGPADAPEIAQAFERLYGRVALLPLHAAQAAARSRGARPRRSPATGARLRVRGHDPGGRRHRHRRRRAVRARRGRRPLDLRVRDHRGRGLARLGPRHAAARQPGAPRPA